MSECYCIDNYGSPECGECDYAIAKASDRILTPTRAMRNHLRDQTRRKIEARSYPMAEQIFSVLDRWARVAAMQETDKYLGRFTKMDADERFIWEMMKVLELYGLRQFDEAGSEAATRAGGEWVIKPAMVQRVMEAKAIKIQGLAKDIKAQVKESVRRVVAESSVEIPRPSAGEVARRIREALAGQENREPIFSYERALLVARTELVQAENTGIYEGYKVAGVEEIEWLAYADDGRSGDRRHYEMNGERVKLGEMFVTPLGNEMRYPGDPRAPIEETANCRCTHAPVRVKR